MTLIYSCLSFSPLFYHNSVDGGSGNLKMQAPAVSQQRRLGHKMPLQVRVSQRQQITLGEDLNGSRHQKRRQNSDFKTSVVADIMMAPRQRTGALFCRRAKNANLSF